MENSRTNFADRIVNISYIVTSDRYSLKKSKNPRKSISIALWGYFFVVLLFTVGSMVLSSVKDVNNSFRSSFEITFFVILIIDIVMRTLTIKVRFKKTHSLKTFSWITNFFHLETLMLVLALLPSLYLIGEWTNEDWEIYQILKGLQFLRIFRIILLLNIFLALRIFKEVIFNQWKILTAVFAVIILTILLFALTIYTIESSNSYNYLEKHPNITKQQAVDDGYIFNYWQAVYYSTIALTTIGFGDIHPHTTMGQAVTVLMSLIGIAIIATPTGIIAAGFTKAIKESKQFSVHKK